MPWIVAGAAVCGLVLAAGILVVFASAINSKVRSRAQAALASRFDADVEFQNLDVGVFPSFRLTASGMTLRRGADTDLPPLVKASSIRAESSVIGLLLGHVRRVKLEGLLLSVPLGRANRPQASGSKKRFPVVIDELASDDAHLELLRTKSEKPPLEFYIHRLRMKSVDLDKPAPFHATLSNPAPRGEIEATGQFGPWDAEEPSATPVSGTYEFSRADLSTFSGLGGNLSSQGKFKGILRRIDVDGDTDTPGFLLTLGAHPMPLRTTFHATVDGTNGNTWLHAVDGKLKNTPILANGEITKAQDEQGRRILLDGVVNAGRLEDVLELAVKSSPPPMSGLISLRSRIDLPPGDGHVIRRLRLDGDFDIRSARFSSLNIREKLQSLSRKAQGKPHDENAGSAISNLRGHFEMKGAVATFSSLTFEVEGAALQLAGRYQIEDEQMDFHGKLLLDAKLSQTVTGAKAFFLKALDPLFHKKGGGSEIPIRISGSRSNPSFGLDVGRKF